jgi:hypothetical protein
MPELLVQQLTVPKADEFLSVRTCAAVRVVHAQ